MFFVHLDLPPFPDNGAPPAPLLKISFTALAAANSDEATRLFTVTRETGSFYLDLRGTSEDEFVPEDVDEMFGLAEKLRQIDDGEREYLSNTLKKDGPFGTALVPRSLRIWVDKVLTSA